MAQLSSEDVVMSTYDKLKLADRLTEKVSMCDSAHFKSQQIGDPDLTVEEKREIVTNILDRGPALFLSRFHQHLTCDDLDYFEPFENDYEVNFYLESIRERNQVQWNAKVVKNRRYKALQKLVKDGTYFSDYELRNRNPEMFEKFVGQYMSRKEKDAVDASAHRDENNPKLSDLLMKRLNDDQKPTDDYETDSDSDEELPAQANETEKQMFRNEFLNNMHQSFLEGLDADFDYSSVDNNVEYDSLDILQQDAEDKYFDSENVQD